MSAAELIDEAVEGRVLVVGSLPPRGRDLDLLARPAEREAIVAALSRAGFRGRGGDWVRFAGCSAEVVDLNPAAEWHLPSAEVEALLSEAVPLDGADHLARPAPHHALLIVARRWAASGGRLDAKLQGRLERALAEDPQAWSRAQPRAAAWGVQRDLQRLAAAQRDGGRPGTDGGGQGEAGAWASVRGRLAALRAVARPSGSVVALSGLDGAGKSTQAQALRDALQRCGFDATIEWSRIGYNEGFWRLVVPVKTLLASLLRLLGRGGTGLPSSSAETSPAADPVKAMRQRNELATQLWALVVALDNIVAHRRQIQRHLVRGRVVICDRYELDSIVSLRYQFGRRRFGVQRRLLGLLLPCPLRAYLLDVAAQTAFQRKGEHDLESLDAHATLYRDEQARLGVRQLDGERPPEELCATIASDVWDALGR